MNSSRKQSPSFVEEMQSSARIAWLPWSLILIGIALRLAQYLANRSLWLDESFLALNILHRSFQQLLQPLDYNQGAPLAFLMVEKLAVEVLGSSEYALRFFPFLCGTMSLFLFHNIVKHLLSFRGILIALTLFAISWPQIYYSSELKQYSSDITIALLLYSMAIYALHQDRIRILYFAIFGFSGSIALWFSHPAFFILVGIAVGLILHRIKHPQWVSVPMFLLLLMVWAISFLLVYLISLSRLSENKVLLDYWNDSFMPILPRSLSDAKWFFSTFFSIFETPVGLSFSGLAALAFVIGCHSLFPTIMFPMIIFPLTLSLLASGIHKYPFSGRLLLFLTPAIFILIAEGASYIYKKTLERGKIIGIVFIVLLLSMPAFLTANSFVNPILVEEIRPVINYLRTQKQADDVIYLYYSAYYAFKYYQERDGYLGNDYIVGKISRHESYNYVKDLDNLRGRKRVWVLFSHVQHDEFGNQEKVFLFYLDTIGTKLDSYKAPGASVYLYDLSLPG